MNFNIKWFSHNIFSQNEEYVGHIDNTFLLILIIQQSIFLSLHLHGFGINFYVIFK